jgi:type I restriction enzyme S subunit
MNQKLVDLREYIPSDWEYKKIKYISKLYGRIGFRGYTTDDLVDEYEGAISLSPSNMVDGKTITDKCTFLSWDKYYESPEIMIQDKDILLVKTGSTYGKLSFVESVEHPMTLNPQIAVFKNVKIDNRYLFYSLSQKVIQDEFKYSNTGSTIPTMNQETIVNLTISIPSNTTQKQIADFLDKETTRIDTLITKKQKQIELLNEKRQAIITQSVTKGLDENVKMKDSGVEWIGEIPEHWGRYQTFTCSKES